MKKLLLFIALIPVLNGFSQVITTSGGLTATQLANILASPGIVVSNAVLTGSGVASGQFNRNGSTFLLNSGVILSTGNIAIAPGPNGADGSGNNANTNLGTAGTAEMTALGGANSFEAITLEFDFVVQSTSIAFNYIFASEEYPEYAPPNSSGFNDVFAFYISGPGIAGSPNIALIPTTTSPVTINNINPVTNSQLYVDNTGGAAVQYDGFTTQLTATRTGLTPCQTYHLRLVIADIGDRFYNSAVFLEENSLVQGEVVAGETQTVNADGVALEGCIQGHFDFNLAAPLSYDVVINYTVGGTAVNGVDYANIGNSITIPAGDTTGSIFVDAVSDGITEGQETITITYLPSICEPSQTITLLINDAQPISFSLAGTNLDCNDDQSGEIAISATGGFPAYTYIVTNSSGTSNTTTSNPITGLDAGQYTVQVLDSYGCKATALVVGGSFNAGQTFLPDGGGVTYEAPLTISGFNPGLTITNVNQIQQICVNMEHSYDGDLLIRIQSPSGQIMSLKGNGGGSADLGEPIATGQVDGNSTDITPGIGYSYCFDASPFYSTMNNESANFFRNYTDGIGNSYSDNYLPAGSYQADQSFSALLGSQMNGVWKILVTDQFALDNGYIFNWDISLIGDLPDSTVVLTEPTAITVSGVTTNTTCGTSNGAININIINGVSPFTYSWSNGATTEDLTAIPAGIYTVNVTDASGCVETHSFTINNIGSLAISGTITSVTCGGGNNGAVAVNASGGATPYTYSWTTGATTQNITNLMAGNYSVTLVDQNGCQLSQTFTVPQNNPVQINLVSLTDELCNTTNGAIDVSVIGGNGSYAYSWSNGQNTQDLANLSAGVFNLSVSDGLGCTTTSSYTVSNNLSGCSNICYLDVQTNSTVNSTCGNANGSINISVLNAVNPIQIVWSNGATTEDISGLLAGTYMVTVTDANNCSDSQTITVSNNTGTLNVSNPQITNETCGFGNGALGITTSGGLAPYSYNWSNGATTEDITNLDAGSYTVQVTDANSCIVSQSYSIANNSGSLQISGTAYPSTCAQSDGSITQVVDQSNGSVSYVWSSGQTTQNLTNLSSGNYSCTATDASGCSVTNSYTVSASNTGIEIQSILITNEVCNNTQGAINLTVSGIGLTYLWSNGATTEDVSGLNSGNYSCTITNTSGCTVSTGNLSIINTAGNVSVINSGIIQPTCTTSNGAIDISVSGGTPTYVYSWSNGATTQDITALAPGNYTVLVSDANGCSLSHSVVLTNSSGGLTITNSVITNENCSGGVPSSGQGAINITVAGATTPYAYSWTTGATSQDVTGLTAGNYTVTVTAANGCTLQGNYSIASNGSNLAISGSSVSDETCGSQTGSVNIQLASGSGPHSFSWSNGLTTEDIYSLSAGIYSVTVSNTFGCQVTGSYTVSNDAGTLALSGIATNETCGNQNGAIDLSTTGGNLPLSYAWNSGNTTQDITALSAGNYTVVVTDLFGCTANYSSVIVNNAGGLTIAFTTVTPDQCGQSIGAINATFSGSPITSVWSSGQTTEDISNIPSGTYSVTISDAAGCSTTASTTVINQTGTLAISFQNASPESCGNGEGFVDIQVSGTGPFSYSWSNGASTQDITALSSGSYSVAITDGLGCILTQTFVVGNVNSTNLSASANLTAAACGGFNGAIDITVTDGVGPFSYSWSNGETTQDIDNIQSGVYTLTLSDVANCEVNYSYSIIDNAPTPFTVIDIQPDNCLSYTGYVELNNDPNVMEWQIDGFGNFGPQFFGIPGGTHTITTINADGCSYSEVIVVPNIINFTETGVVTNASCGLGGSIDVTVDDLGQTGTFDHFWYSGENTEDISNLVGGEYTIQTGFTTSSGTCYNLVTFTVGDDDLSISASQTDDNCGAGIASINQTIDQGTGVTFLWNTGATTEDLSGLITGNYSCTVSSTSGCTQTYNYFINNTTSGFFVFITPTDEYCGSGDGSILAAVFGQSGTVSYQWSSGETTQSIFGLSAGTYTVTVTDSFDGCSTSETVTITNFPIYAEGFATDASCATCANGSIDVYAFAGSSTLSYQWSNGAISEDLFNLLPGTYSVTVTSSSGCDTTLTFTVLGLAGVSENTNPITLVVYPNPTTSNFTVEYSIQGIEEVSFYLTDVLGNLVVSKSTTNETKFSVDVQGLSDGIYFLHLDAGTISRTERIVVEKE